MSIFQKIKAMFSQFMQGRNGIDRLSITLIWTGLFVHIIGTILSGVTTPIVFAWLGMLMTLISYAVDVFAVFRIFSRNTQKRRAENSRYLAWMNDKKTKTNQAKVRFANRRVYKYFHCPGCKAWLRIKRNAGVVTVTCSRCHANFTQKS